MTKGPLTKGPLTKGPLTQIFVRKQMNIQHTLEQLGAMLRDFAPILRNYYLSLIETGFTEDQALILVVTYQQYLFGGTRNEK